MNFQGAN